LKISKNIEQKIGFVKLRHKLLDFCISERGKKLVNALNPTREVSELAQRFKQLEEFQHLKSKLGISLRGTEANVDQVLKVLDAPHNVLNQEEFLELGYFLRDAQFIFRTLENNPSLTELGLLMHDLDGDFHVLHAIEDVFEEDGEWKKTCSKEHEKLVDSIELLDKSIYKHVNKLYSSLKEQGLTPETEISIKDGRMVIPVKASKKKQVKGIVHGDSQGGNILYIEPLEVVEKTNVLKEYNLALQRERNRILKDLTAQVRDYVSDFKKYNQLLAFFDFLQAKDRLGATYEGIAPALIASQEIKLIKAYHPLLLWNHKKEDVVPLNLELNEDSRILIISGPNAGGKSVAMKTVMLTQYMFQCGLSIPCDPMSELGVFSSFMVDIGDDQSIEQDLSSYSSHLKNMKWILAHCDKESLVGIDEIGSGTEPQFGGALAEAMLMQLAEKQVKGVVTTHYRNIKLMANETNGLVNANMVFNVKELKPEYILSVGQPGSSFAFEVAQKIGLHKNLLKTAKSKVDKKQQRVDELLAEIEAQKVSLEQNLKQAKKERREHEQYKEDYLFLKENLEKTRKQILKEQKEKALEVYFEAEKEAKKLVKTIKKSEGSTKVIQKAKKDFVDQKNKVYESLQKEDPEKYKKPKREKKPRIPVKVGDRVKIKGKGIEADVLEIKGTSALVSAGIMKTRFQLKDLQVIQPEKQEVRKSGSSHFIDFTKDFKTEKDIRGMRGEEAMTEIENWLDQALVLRIPEVRVLHGKGDGILKNLLRARFGGMKEVKRIRYEHINMGGHGVSIIELNV
jgi:DNA mismatch repair protein MutS2